VCARLVTGWSAGCDFWRHFAQQVGWMQNQTAHMHHSRTRTLQILLLEASSRRKALCAHGKHAALTSCKSTNSSCCRRQHKSWEPPERTQSPCTPYNSCCFGQICTSTTLLLKQCTKPPAGPPPPPPIHLKHCCYETTVLSMRYEHASLLVGCCCCCRLEHHRWKPLVAAC
jgi:hypothetical protein